MAEFAVWDPSHESEALARTYVTVNPERAAELYAEEDAHEFGNVECYVWPRKLHVRTPNGEVYECEVIDQGASSRPWAATS